MRKTPLLLALCLLVSALATAPTAASPRLAVEVPTVLTSTPFELAVTLRDPEAPTLRVLVFVDGSQIGEHSLAPGENRLVYEEVRLAAGTHEVLVKSGSVEAAASVRLLPGWTSILPPLLAIGLALLTRDVLVSLFLGIFGGALLIYAGNPFVALARSIDSFIMPALADPDHAAILVFTTCLGGMVGMLTKSGGTHGIVSRLTPYATSPRRGQLATWMMGVLVFFDDYANTLIVGPTMRPITDKLRISREKLAYIVDSTAAPVVCLIPISTWVGFEIGLVGDAFRQLELPFDAYTTFIYSIPYRFYPVFAILMVLSVALWRVDFGPMRAAEKRAREQGLLLAEDARPIADYGSAEVEPPAEIPKRAINALLPIVTVISITLLGLYLTGSAGKSQGPNEALLEWLRRMLADADSYKALMWGSLSGMLMALALPLAQRLLKLREAMTGLVAGCRAMFLAFMVLILAWSLSTVCDKLDTAEFLVGISRGTLAPVWLPALTFVLSAAIAFATGSSWGTMGILEPLVIPICHNLATGAGLEVAGGPYTALMLGTVASVLSGSVWGDHCSPISDTTILSSMASGCDHIAHVRTQLPYALSMGLLGIALGSIPTAFGLSPWLSLGVGAVVIVGGVWGLGKQRGGKGDDGEDSEEAQQA